MGGMNAGAQVFYPSLQQQQQQQMMNPYAYANPYANAAYYQQPGAGPMPGNPAMAAAPQAYYGYPYDYQQMYHQQNQAAAAAAAAGQMPYGYVYSTPMPGYAPSTPVAVNNPNPSSTTPAGTSTPGNTSSNTGSNAGASANTTPVAPTAGVPASNMMYFDPNTNSYYGYYASPAGGAPTMVAMPAGYMATSAGPQGYMATAGYGSPPPNTVNANGNPASAGGTPMMMNNNVNNGAPGNTMSPATGGNPNNLPGGIPYTMATGMGNMYGQPQYASGMGGDKRNNNRYVFFLH